jgi:hypothetical protein
MAKNGAFQKKFERKKMAKMALLKRRTGFPQPASLSAEPPPQKDSGETRFFNSTRATTRNLLAGFLAQPRPPRALVW